MLTIIIGHIINILSILHCFYWGVTHHGTLYMSLCLIIICNLPIFHQFAHIIIFSQESIVIVCNLPIFHDLSHMVIFSQESIVIVMCLSGPFDLSHCVIMPIMWYHIFCIYVLRYTCRILFIFCSTGSNIINIVIGHFWPILSVSILSESLSTTPETLSTLTLS